MKSHWKKKCRAFYKNEVGAVAIMFAIALPVLLVLFGGVIDFGAAQLVRSQLNSATDAASIIGAKAGFTLADRQEMASRYFVANYPEEIWGVAVTEDDITVTESGGGVRIATSPDIQYDSMLLSIAGIDQVAVASASSFSRSAGADYDIVLVMDRSGSMDENSPNTGEKKWDGALDAARQFINKVIQVDNANARVSVVFFNGNSRVEKNLSNDRGYLKDLTVKPTGITCGQCGLLKAEDVFRAKTNSHTPRSDDRKVSKTKMIIMLSDGKFNAVAFGQDSTGASRKAIEVADSIKATWPKATIYTIYLDSIVDPKDSGAVQDRKDAIADLKKIATLDENGDPRYVLAEDTQKMRRIFNDIAEKIQVMRMTE